MANHRKPTALKLIEGNKGKRALNKQEPDPEYLNDLTAPDWLDEGATEVWNEIVPVLREAKLLTKADVPTLCAGCVAFAKYRLATRRLGDDLVVEGPKGGNYVNTWMIAQSMAFKQAMGVFEKFGMSPQARTRIAVNPQGGLFDGETENSASRFFK